MYINRYYFENGQYSENTWSTDLSHYQRKMRSQDVEDRCWWVHQDFKDIFTASEKITSSRCPLGEAAAMLRFVSLVRHHCYLDAAINGIGSSGWTMLIHPNLIIQGAKNLSPLHRPAWLN
jgi:hypothetical protein